MSDVPSIPDAPSAALADDVPCLACGYNLRGLTADKTCPECGAPVQRSLDQRYLHQAAPAWLAVVRVGIALLLGRYALELIGQAVTWLVLRLLVPVTGRNWQAFSLVMGGLEIAAELAGAVGIWLATQAPPGGDPAAGLVVLRRAARVGALAAAGLRLGTLLLWVALSRGGTVLSLPAGLEAVWYSTHIASGLAWVIGGVGAWMVLRRYALRRPARALPALTLVLAGTQVLGWGMYALGLLLVVSHLVSQWGFAVYQATSCLHWLWLLATGVVLTAYLVMFTRALREARALR